MAKKLMKGCEAIGEAAVQAGCRLFFGYPITPQNEIPEYLSGRLPQVGGTFVQAESEVAAVNMLYGASGAGCRCFTSSSSPGISLMQEGISYIAAAELPVVFVNIMRGGPGLGGILPSQSDYFQATKGGGHGDYRMVVLGPASLQELADLTMDAFDIADEYRTPVMILADGMLGQMMEPVVFKKPKPRNYPESLIMKGAGGGKSKIIRGLILDPLDLEEHIWKLQRKYQMIAEKETRSELYQVDDAELIIVAYGTASRIAKGAIKRLRKQGLKVGLFRPITLWPFPAPQLRDLAKKVGNFMVFEMSAGQMIEDVLLALQGKANVGFHGRPGGVVPTPVELANVILRKYNRKEGLIDTEL